MNYEHAESTNGMLDKLRMEQVRSTFGAIQAAKFSGLKEIVVQLVSDEEETEKAANEVEQLYQKATEKLGLVLLFDSYR